LLISKIILFSCFGRHTALVTAQVFTFIGCLLRRGIPEDFASPRRALPAPPGPLLLWWNMFTKGVTAEMYAPIR